MRNFSFSLFHLYVNDDYFVKLFSLLISASYSKNPQYRVKVTDPDENDEEEGKLASLAHPVAHLEGLHQHMLFGASLSAWP